MKTILESQTARMLMKEGSGFSVPAITLGKQTTYRSPSASLAANLKGVNFQSWRPGRADYMVRVWPKREREVRKPEFGRPYGGAVKPWPEQYKPGDPPGTYTATRELTDREIADTIRQAERSIEAQGKTVYRGRR